ncbi:MAG: topoisomerase DNA-binding C4 zinc finger domain-containing protein [Caldisericum sp.]|nr:topoisomerase DNA-binding C4 zinc finger domain-containing protein [Caldisericum sp.]
MSEYIGWRATQGPSDINKLIAEFQEALDDEIEALKKGQGGQKIFIENGKLIDRLSEKFLYRFYVELERTIPEDTPCQVIIGPEIITAHIVSVDPNEIVLALNKNFGPFISQAIIQIAPWFLLEQLKTRLEEVSQNKLQGFNVQNALKLFGFVKPKLIKAIANQNFNETKINLNPRQKDALSKALSQEITFIWGPPGTGKTRTIAAIIEKFVEMNKVMLLTAHTNAAIDEALLKLVEILSNKELLEEGKIIRYGIPTRNDPVFNKIAFDEILARKRELLIKEKEALETEIENLKQSYRLFEKLIMLCDKLTQIIEKETSLQKDIEEIEKSILELERQLRDVKENLKHLEKQLEKAKNTFFLIRFFTGLDPKQIEQKIIEEQKKEQELLTKKAGLVAHVKKLEEKRSSLRKEFEELKERIEQLFREAEVEDCKEAQAKFKTLDTKLQELKQKISIIQAKIENLPREILDNCLVVGATLSKLVLDPFLYKRNYAVMVLDEASMAPLPAIFFTSGLITERFIVTGDFRQLPPIAITDTDMSKKWLKRDIFEQAGIVDRYESGLTDERLVKLTMQHRMHPAIVEIINAKMYGGELETSEETLTKTSEIVAKEPFSDFSLIFCDTSQINPWCSRPWGSQSHFNVYQAVLCCRIAQGAVEAGIKRVGIITPYAAQAKLIATILKNTGLIENVRVATVHRFQGGEEDIIIFDAVDGPPLRNPGKFLYGSFPGNGQTASEASKLINVAVTRAKGKLILVANYSFFLQRMNKDDALLYVLNFIYQNGKIVDSRDILPSYFNESILIRHPYVQQISELKHWEIWKEGQFYEQFLKDLVQAEKKVIIFSPFLAQKRVANLGDIFRYLIDKGVALYVITRPATEKKKDPELVDLYKYLKEIGVKLIYREKLHEKVAFIDDKVCWLGSLNILSHSETSEFMLSIRAKEVITQLYQFFGVDAIIGTEEKQNKTHSIWESLQKEIITLMQNPLCPKCGASVVLRCSKYGIFLGCERHSQTRCQGKVNIPPKIIEDAVKKLKIKCPHCKEGFMRYCMGSKGPFLGCDKYPECQYTIDLKYNKQKFDS